jgi:ACS family hexuronate transporter-like MFS transporter
MHLPIENRSSTSAGSRQSGLRWWVATFLFFATLINFLNRLTVAVLSPAIVNQLHLSSAQFASLTTSFLVAYTISQGLSGKLFDVIGTKLGFVLSVTAWSIVSMAHAFARGLPTLDSLRFLLGMAEGGAWPGAAKAIAEWFPMEERALAMGICNSGTALGTLVSTPLLIWIELRFGWRVTFVAVGLPGLVWVLLWTIFYRHPETEREMTSDLAKVDDDRVPSLSIIAPEWREILRRREAWAIMLARFFGDPVWWFYITWLPLYLFKARHFTLQQIGMFAWIPFVAADAGSLFGGALSGFLIRSGWSVDRGRKFVIAGSTALMLCGIPAALAHSSVTALALIAVVLFGFQSWIGNVQTLCSDYFPQTAVGSVMGLGGVGAGLGAMFLTETTGFVVDHFSYMPILLVAGLLPVIATVVLWTLGGTIRPISPLEFANPSRTAARQNINR